MKKAVMWHKCLPYWCLSAPAPLPPSPAICRQYSHNDSAVQAATTKEVGGGGGVEGGLNLYLEDIKSQHQPGICIA